MPALTVTEHKPIDPALDLFDEIKRLKTEMDAVILAHYYQEPDIQDLADSVGDSLQLARFAEKTTAKVIVFAGVHFMAETAKILNPDKLVLMPDADAGCSLADSCPPETFARFKAAHPGHYVVSYVNCSAAIKALSDVIVTSSNAENIVRQIPADQPIIFAPDKNLGAYIAKKLGRDMVLWNGSCIVHEIFSEARIVLLKSQHPGALVLAHPECESLVLRHADFIGSTAGIRKFARESESNEFIIATEPGIIHPMQKDCPAKTFIPAPPNNSCECNFCPHMRRNTIEKLYLCMRDKRPALQMDEKLRIAALAPIRRMLEMS